MPEIARRPCRLPVLPVNPTQADLDAGYAARATALALCDEARTLSNETFDAQQRALQPLPRPWWRRLTGG